MSKPTYYELLRDPRWQKKRLEVMGRDRFTCCDCGSTSKTLNVHHSYYEKGKMPWEYPDNSLHTLCEDCHEVWQHKLTRLHRLLGMIDLKELDNVIGYITAVAANSTRNDLADLPIMSMSEAWGFGDFVGVVADEVNFTVGQGRTLIGFPWSDNNQTRLAADRHRRHEPGLCSGLV